MKYSGMTTDGEDDFSQQSRYTLHTDYDTCENCYNAMPLGSGELMEIISIGSKSKTVNVCKSCAEVRKVYFTESEYSERMRYAATVYEQNQMIIGFGPTEPAAIADLKEKFMEQFDRDLLNFSRG